MPDTVLPPAPVLRRPLILAAVMTATFMTSIESTIVSTAMPTIAAELGELKLYAWVFSAFLLTQTATTVVFGRLADIFGRRPVLVAGIFIFLAGSVLCGLAWSMQSLIVCRLLQGLGAGAIQPVCLTIIGDLYPGRERGRVQGYLASVWGVSSVLGPLAGGLLTRALGWPWIFWINIPVGLLAAAGIMLFLRDRRGAAAARVDVMGALLFTVAIAALMVLLTELGTGPAPLEVAALAVFVAATALFVWQERRCREPMIVYRLWARRPIRTANAATFLSGATMVGLSAFLPMYVQGVLGRSALVAGFCVTAMVLGWPISSVIAARSFPRVGMRRTLIWGGVLMPLGAAGLPLLAVDGSVLVAGLASLVIGFGMGALSVSCVVLVQSSVGWEERATVTAANIFSRSLGSTLGATVLGGVLNASLARGGGSHRPVTMDEVRTLLDRGASVGDEMLRAALGHSLLATFWAMLAMAVLTLVTTLRVPDIRMAAPPG